VLVGGPLASQKGLGLLIPAQLVEISGIGFLNDFVSRQESAILID